jgi:hypothetical protein
MSENTQAAQCSDAEWDAAMASGLLTCISGTSAQERAIHSFAEYIRRGVGPVRAYYELDRLKPLTRESLGTFSTAEQAKTALVSWAKDNDWHMQILRVETDLVYDNKSQTP